MIESFFLYLIYDCANITVMNHSSAAFLAPDFCFILLSLPGLPPPRGEVEA